MKITLPPLSSLFQNSKTDLSDHLPLLGFYDNNTLITKDGNFCRILVLDGLDYTGLDDDEKAREKHLRLNTFKNLVSTIQLDIHTERTHVHNEFEDDHSSLSVGSNISAKWSEPFFKFFTIKHYVVLTTGNENLLDDLDSIIKNKQKDMTRLTDLNDATSTIKKQLKHLNPSELNKQEITSFFGNIINGSNRTYNAPITNFDHYLQEFNLSFKQKDHFIHENPTQNRYVMILSIKFFESDVSAMMLDELLLLKNEFRIIQSFQKLEKTQALKMIEDKTKTVNAWMKNNDIANQELYDLGNLIQADELALGRFNYTVHCHGNTLEEAKETIDAIRGVIQSYGFTATIETNNLEALFWAQFPTNNDYNVRIRYMTNENLSDFQSFSRTSKGLESCSWGHKPITKFFTPNGSVYNFTFHESAENQALGHTLIFGGSNMGKSTLLSFLISQCTRYEGFKALMFDKLQGLRIFTESHGGIYSDFKDGIHLNPCKLEDDQLNRSFLAQFFALLSNTNIDEDKDGEKLIHEAVNSLYDDLEPDDRKLDNILEAFGLATHNDIRKALDQWGSKGSNGSVFASDIDSLNFNSSLVAFNMDYLLKNPKILTSVMLYISHKLRTLVTETHTPHAIFIDEFKNYIENPNFEKIISEWVLEVRKLEGVLIAAAQSPKHVTDSEVGIKLLSSFANFIFFPDPNAEAEGLKKHYNLNDSEINWIKEKGQNREILLKRNNTGESIILNVDLSHLDKYLQLFNSSSSEVLRMKAVQANNEHWVNDFLDGAKS